MYVFHVVMGSKDEALNSCRCFFINYGGGGVFLFFVLFILRWQAAPLAIIKNLLKKSLTGNNLGYKLASIKPTETKSRYNVAEETKLKQSTFIHLFI